MSLTSTQEFEYNQKETKKTETRKDRLSKSKSIFNIVNYSEYLERLGSLRIRYNDNYNEVKSKTMTLINKLKELDISDVCDNGDLTVFENNKTIVNKLLAKISKMPQIVPEEDCSFTMHFTSKLQKSILLSVFNGGEIKILERGKTTINNLHITEVAEYINNLI